MAKVIHAGGAQISGSIGATTYARNGVARRRSNPVNTITTRKTAVQGIFASLAASWRMLDKSVRDQWIGAVSRVDRLGQTIVLAPMAAYMAVNAYRRSTGDAATDVPLPFATDCGVIVIGPVAAASATPAEREIAVNLSNPTGAAVSVVIEATPPLSAGIVNFENQLRQIIRGDAATGSAGFDITDNYVDIFGGEALDVPNIGKLIGVRVRAYNNGNPIFLGTGFALIEAAS